MDSKVWMYVSSKEEVMSERTENPRYSHKCLGCNHRWSDDSRYYNCPWCGEPVTNRDFDEDNDDD